jgi:hypothetical protein
MNQVSSGQNIVLTTEDLIQMHFYRGGPLDLTTAQIKDYLQSMSGRNVSLSEVGKALKTLGFQSEMITTGRGRKKVFSCGQR